MTEPIVLGVDGGGTSTVAIAARRSPSGELTWLSRGESGPANPRSVGWPEALTNLELAISAAAATADCRSFDAICLNVAGCGRADDQRQLQQWLDKTGLTTRSCAVDDGQAVLRAGTPEGVGIGIIAGTGSLVVGRNCDGQTARAGGWGYLLGDEGSGWALGRDGLAAVMQAWDAVGATTELTDRLQVACRVTTTSDLVDWIYSDASTMRTRVAALAPVVLQCAAAGDEAALAIVWRQLHGLERQVRAVVDRLGLGSTEFSVALSGGVLQHNRLFRDRLLAELRVPQDPAQCACMLAGDLL